MDSIYANYLLKKVQGDYNDIAEDFARTRSSLWPEIRFLKDYAKEEDKVLDIGCGSGRLYELFGNKEIEYFGIDFAKKLIEIAKKKHLESKDLENQTRTKLPTFFPMNALALPFDSDFFDKVFSVAVFHHIPSKEKRLEFLLEIKRVLKPEGELFLTVWNLWQKKYLTLISKFTSLKILKKTKLDFCDVFIPFQGKQRYYHCFKIRELKGLTKEAGFEVKEIKYLQRNHKNYNIYLRARNI